jgi:tyrosinase
MEGNPHAGGHNGVGGEMRNAISSPGGNVSFLPSPTATSPRPLFSGLLKDSFSHLDPLFYLHHAFLDRVWWQWQQRDLPARLRDIAGYTTQSEPATGWVDATLNDELNMFGIIPNAKVRDVMDIRGGGRLCYDYV